MSIPTSRVLTTDRLLLREMNPESYNYVMGYLSDDEIKHYLGISLYADLEDEKTRFNQGMTMAGRSFLYFHLLDKESQKVLGWCGYHTWFLQHQRAEIGYVMNDDAQKGKGYMKEALLPVLKFGFEEMNLHRIEALIAPANTPSLKLVERVGFVKEGLLREHYKKNNKIEDSLIFSLLRSDYNKYNY